MTTLLAAFDNERTAEAAADQLAKAGVPREEIHIESDLARLKALARTEDFGRDSVLGSAGRMFADLVRTNIDHHHVDVVTEALERGATVLLARTPDERMADTASALLRAAGAYDVRMRAAARSG